MNKRQILSAEALLTDIEIDWNRQRTGGDPQYIIPYDLLSRLVHSTLQSVPDTNGEFITSLGHIAEELPESAARIVLQELLEPSMDRDQVGALYRLFWSVRWQAFGCPAVTMDAPLAAALMLTETDPDLLDDVKPPWPCFVIRLPLDLVSDGSTPYTHVVVHHFRREELPAEALTSVPDDLRSVAERIHAHAAALAGPTWGIYGMSDGRGQLQQEGTLLELLGKERRDHLIEPAIPDADVRHRIIEVLTRLSVGVCQLVAEGSTLREKSTKKGRQHWRLGRLPTSTEYVLSSSARIAFDGTESVRLYTRGESRTLPKLQWVVRGHWRRQACGPGLQERRRAWVQPYWKGPVGAPRPFRGHPAGAPPERDDE